MPGYLGNIAAVLETKSVIDVRQIAELKNYIAFTRPGISRQEAARLLAEAIKGIIDRQLLSLPGRKQAQLKNRLIQTALKKPVFQLTLADVLEACLRLRYTQNGHAAELAAWVGRNIGKTVPISKIYELSTFFEDQNDLQPERGLREVAVEIEEGREPFATFSYSWAGSRERTARYRFQPKQSQSNRSSQVKIKAVSEVQTKPIKEIPVQQEMEPVVKRPIKNSPVRYLVNLGAAVMILVLSLVGGGLFQTSHNNDIVSAAGYDPGTVTASPPLLTPATEEPRIIKKSQVSPKNCSCGQPPTTYLLRVVERLVRIRNMG